MTRNPRIQLLTLAAASALVCASASADPASLETCANLANQAIGAAASGGDPQRACPGQAGVPLATQAAAAAPEGGADETPCDRWDDSLDPVNDFTLADTAPAAAANVAHENLKALALTHAKVELAASCEEQRMPMLKGAAATYRFAHHGPLNMEDGLRFLSRLDHGSLSNMLAEFKALQAKDPDFDPALAAATAFRESGAMAWVASDTPVNTHTQGGLRFLGASLGTVHKYLPDGYGGSWHRGPTSTNALGEVGEPVILPQRDMPMAYGAWLLHSKDNFKEAARKYGFTDEEINGLSTDARRVWTGIFFAAPGGVEYDKPHPNDPDHIGAITIISNLKGIMARNRASGLPDHGLEDILTSPELYRYKNVELATAAAANADLIESHLGID